MIDAHNFTIDFIGIGAPRCGTTWLSACLRQHPEICFSSEKETQFFDQPYNRNRGLSHYASFFVHAQPGQVLGEFTPAYYLHDAVAHDIETHFPCVKLLIILRDPVDRFISDINYSARRTGIQHDVDELLAAQDSRFVQAGFYHRYLSKFLRGVPSAQVKIIWYDDIKSSPEKVLTETYRFLGVDPAFIPASASITHNARGDVGFRFPLLYRIVNVRKQIKKHWLGFHFIQVLRFFQLHKIAKWLLDKNRQSSSQIEIAVTKEQQRQLYRLYQDDIRALEDTHKIRLDEWHQYDS